MTLIILKECIARQTLSIKDKPHKQYILVYRPQTPRKHDAVGESEQRTTHEINFKWTSTTAYIDTSNYHHRLVKDSDCIRQLQVMAYSDTLYRTNTW